MMSSNNKQLSQLLDMTNPLSVQKEAKRVILLKFSDFDFTVLDQTVCSIVNLFNGMFPGYQACSTTFHDLPHTTDTFLAMVRLMDGYMIENSLLSERAVRLGSISALGHDTGYILTVDDKNGTGAKYTKEHITRSIGFMRKYFELPEQDMRFCENILQCTGLDVKINEIKFSSPEEKRIGMMLGTADLLSQMSDRVYLEKLLFLYQELKEGEVKGYESELDLLRKTPGFYNFTKQRFSTELGGVDRFMRNHFRERFGIDKDLYAEAISNNLSYLTQILENDPENYRAYLRRRVAGALVT